VDGNGLTADDIDELGGDEFLQDYLGGVYDVRCGECGGNRVVPACACGQATVQDYASCYDHLNEDERADADDEISYQAEVAAELRAGA
jgi:hypothetical protein